MDELRLEASDEARAAREYTYSRWPEEFCSTSGLGYAPKDGHKFEDYCKTKCIDTDVLLELGLLKKDDNSRVYPMFRERIMIPIRNRWGRVMAFTARYIGENRDTAKLPWMNFSDSAKNA